MRSESTLEKVHRLMDALSHETSGAGRIYLTGGASAVLVGWRDATVDVDLKADPEPRNFFEALAALKQRLDINIELAAPDDFIPALPGWRERSAFIGRFGTLDFFHYDFYAQALAKIERGHARDLADVRQMLERGLIEHGELRCLFEAIVPQLKRYPGIEAAAFRERLADILKDRAPDA
ncbi:MAG: hypothetical protein HY692_00655 [Cyanobacteria bacterium NC_groundwater_1444_Ag_S-0.65um_54_12]|nr:hypothetical protein [Cyanobacteria bacterium NC_groundwater_1444_Ag_S-0.65um_54_12]